MPQASSLFSFDWDAEVPDETRDRVLDRIVQIVRRWRLEVPATLLLETGAPLSHLAGQGLIFGAPWLAPWLPGGITDVQILSKVLEKPENVRRLLDRIADEGLTAEGDDAPRQ